MKMSVLSLFTVYCALASASPVNTVARSAKESRSGNLLQASRNGHPLEMFTGAAVSAGNDVNTVVAEAVASNPCIGSLFCPESTLPGAKDGQKPPHSEEFFLKDAEKMDELPNYANKKPQCHPKCRWSCDNPHCNQLCEPRCQPPKCVTACKKISLARCKRTCKDPQCAVVCPPQCEHGTCPKCKTVCGASVCELNCGKGRCESSCADPDCVWDCKPNPICAKPICKMTCDNSVCAFGKDDKLPNEGEVPYMGQEIAWKGLGKIPEAHLAEFAPLAMDGPKGPIEGSQMFGGSQPLPPGGLQSITGETGITQEAEKDGPTRFIYSPRGGGPQTILTPNGLTTAAVAQVGGFGR